MSKKKRRKRKELINPMGFICQGIILLFSIFFAALLYSNPVKGIEWMWLFFVIMSFASIIVIIYFATKL